MPSLNLIFAALYYVIVVLMLVRVIMTNRQPAKTMAWALVIWFVPVVGIILYLFFGINTRKERLIEKRSMDELDRRSMFGYAQQKDLQMPSEYHYLIDLFVNQSLSLPFQTAGVKVYTDGYQFFPELLSTIASAKDHIHINMYIFEDDALGRLVADALISKVREGVQVRVIYDDVGCWKVPRRFFEHMREEGIEVAPFLPVRFPTFTSRVNYRNHRKLIVIDGSTGFIGGMNIALRYVKGPGNRHSDSSTTPWRDTMVGLTGTAVYSLQRAFLIDWYFVDRTLSSDRRYYPTLPDANHQQSTLLQTVTSGPDTPQPEIMQGYVRAITAARQYVYIETPYFLPTEPVLFALKTAAAAGVDVRILVPLENDAWFAEWAGRSYLREVNEANIKVGLYKAGFLHSKLMVCDDNICTCGSTNVDFRSFENNFEANTFFYGRETALKMKQIFLHDEAQSIPLRSMPRRLKPRFIPRLAEGLLRMLAPVM